MAPEKRRRKRGRRRRNVPTYPAFLHLNTAYLVQLCNWYSNCGANPFVLWLRKVLKVMISFKFGLLFIESRSIQNIIRHFFKSWPPDPGTMSLANHLQIRSKFFAKKKKLRSTFLARNLGLNSSRRCPNSSRWRKNSSRRKNHREIRGDFVPIKPGLKEGCGAYFYGNMIALVMTQFTCSSV